MLITDATAMNRYLAARSEQRSISIKSTALDKESAGTLHYSIYTIPGRLLLSIKESGKFLHKKNKQTQQPNKTQKKKQKNQKNEPCEKNKSRRLRVSSDSAKGVCPACEQSI